MTQQHRENEAYHQNYFAFAAAAGFDPSVHPVHSLTHPPHYEYHHPEPTYHYEEPLVRKDRKTEPDNIVAKRESHKEVERRRRAIINEGIQNLSEIVPGNEKNKGRILQKAVEYIHELTHQSTSDREKWAMEKSFFEKAY
jgi:hypothetical protein